MLSSFYIQQSCLYLLNCSDQTFNGTYPGGKPDKLIHIFLLITGEKKFWGKRILWEKEIRNKIASTFDKQLMTAFIKCMESSGMSISMPESSVKYNRSQIFSLFKKKQAKQSKTVLQAKTKSYHPYLYPCAFCIPFNPSTYPLMQPASFNELLTIYLPF